MFAQTFILPGVVPFLSEERLHNGSEMPGTVSARAERRAYEAVKQRRTKNDPGVSQSPDPKVCI